MVVRVAFGADSYQIGQAVHFKQVLAVHVAIVFMLFLPLSFVNLSEVLKGLFGGWLVHLEQGLNLEVLGFLEVELYLVGFKFLSYLG